MKNINKLLFLLALSGCTFFMSCDEDDNTGDSMINFTAPTVTLSGDDTIIDENLIDPDNPPMIAVTATIPAPVLVDIHIPLVQTGGTGNSSDFSADEIIILAGNTMGLTEVTINKTGDVEGTETLEIGAGPNIANANLNPFTLNVTIGNDYINDVLNLELNWDGEVEYEDDNTTATYNFCAIDFDFLIYDAAFMDTGVYDAATGACPEHLDFDSAWPDGEYIITAYLYDNPLASLDLDAALPVSVIFDQEFFDTSGTITVLGFTTNSVNDTEIPLVTVTKSGYNYTVTPY